MTGMEIYVQGRVQGVGFRYYTFQEAIHHNIKGYVKNLFDGRVKILACADELQLEYFLAKIKIGPRLAKVESITKKEISIEKIPKDFKILHF